MLGEITKLAGKYLRKGGTIRGVAKDVGIQSGVSGLLGTLAGGPVAGLAYMAGDFATNLPLVAAARKWAPGKEVTTLVKDATGKIVTKVHRPPSAIEQGVNLGASVLSPLAVDAVTGGRLYPQETIPTDASQAQQLYQQGIQFQDVNQGAVQALAQGTRFQLQGLPERVTNMPVPGIELLPEQQRYLAQQMSHLQA